MYYASAGGGQCGTVFELSPPKTKGGKWTERVLHSFAGITAGKQNGDGASPNGGLVLDSKGSVYGTTFIGGYNCPHNSNQGCGTTFELKRPTQKGGVWAEKTLHRFRDAPDGGGPAAGLVFDGKGSLYGTTLGGGGGNSGSGTIFELTPHSNGKWVERVLYRFNDGNDGANPAAGLVFDAYGDLYGTAYRGSGGSEYGDVFRLKPPSGKRGSWAFSVLRGFSGSLDPAQPNASLVFDRVGNLYSTSPLGGTGTDCGYGACGTVYRISP